MYKTGGRLWRQRHRRGFWVVVFVYGVSMAFSTVPAPLYVLYRQRDGLNEFMITVVFAAYAAGVIASLCLAGHLSDWLGRRRMLLMSLTLSIMVGVLFVGGSGLAVLLIARFVSGVAVGIASGTITAYLADLHGAGFVRQDRTRSDIVSSATPMLGLGAGALSAGLLAEYAPYPLRLPYVVFIGLLGAAMLAVWRAPETVKNYQPFTYRVRRITVPAGAGAQFFAAGGTALTSFAMLALFSSVAPGFMAGTLHLHSHALGGLVTFLVFAAAAIAPIVTMRLSPRQGLVWGFRCLMGGLLLLMAGIGATHFLIFLLGGVIVGAGAGLLFKGAVSAVAGLAAPESRAGTMAGLFLMAYIGLSVPIVAVGLLTLYVTPAAACIGFSGVFLVVALVLRGRLLAVVRPVAQRRGGSKAGKSFSIASPKLSNLVSAQAGPSISSPTGNPSGVRPTGRERPGIPATDAGLVLRM